MKGILLLAKFLVIQSDIQVAHTLMGIIETASFSKWNKPLQQKGKFLICPVAETINTLDLQHKSQLSLDDFTTVFQMKRFY